MVFLAGQLSLHCSLACRPFSLLCMRRVLPIVLVTASGTGVPKELAIFEIFHALRREVHCLARNLSAGPQPVEEWKWD